MTQPAGSSEPPERSSPLQRAIKAAVSTSESGLYLIVAALLLVTALLVITASVGDVVRGLARDEALIAVGFRLLREILLLLIVAELLHSLRFVLQEGEIPAEPFLFIGLIATVRRVVVITAQAEGIPEADRALTNFLFELGLLSVLAVAFAVAIYLLRRSETQLPDGADRAGSAGEGQPRDPARHGESPHQGGEH